MAEGPTERTKRAIIALAGGRCAFRGCGRSFFDSDSDTFLGEIAHIAAASPNGPRYDPLQTAQQRHGIANLMLLCLEHHAIVDSNPETYSVTVLQQMRAEADELQTAPLNDVLQELTARLGDVANSNQRVADASESIAQLLEYQQKPQIILASLGGTMLMSKFQPEWELEEVGSPRLSYIRYRFLGPRLRDLDVGSEFRDARIDQHGRRRYAILKGSFDLSQDTTPVHQWPALRENDIGLEVSYFGARSTEETAYFRVSFSVREINGKRLVELQRPSPPMSSRERSRAVPQRFGGQKRGPVSEAPPHSRQPTWR